MKIQSQRLLRAVTCMKRKERGQAEQGDGVEEEEEEDDGDETERRTKGSKNAKSKKGEEGPDKEVQPQQKKNEPIGSFVGGSSGGFMGTQEETGAEQLGPAEETVVKKDFKNKLPPSRDGKEKSKQKRGALEAVEETIVRKVCKTNLPSSQDGKEKASKSPLKRPAWEAIEETLVKKKASSVNLPAPSQETKMETSKAEEKQHCPQKLELNSSSSDSDSDNGQPGAMVTAQSVFSNKPTRRGRRGGRGRGKRGL